MGRPANKTTVTAREKTPCSKRTRLKFMCWTKIINYRTKLLMGKQPRLVGHFSNDAFNCFAWGYDGELLPPIWFFGFAISLLESFQNRLQAQKSIFNLPLKWISPQKYILSKIRHTTHKSLFKFHYWFRNYYKWLNIRLGNECLQKFTRFFCDQSFRFDCEKKVLWDFDGKLYVDVSVEGVLSEGIVRSFFNVSWLTWRIFTVI